MSLFKRAPRPDNSHPKANAIADRTLPTWTPEAFRARSLELLAFQRIAWRSCRRLSQGFDATGRLAWVEIAVPSAALSHAMYFVRYEVASDSASCDCYHAQLRQPCPHAGAALTYGRAAREASRA